MKAFFSSFLCFGAALLFAFSVVTPLQAQTAKKKKNPSSKLYVADVEGKAQITTDEKIEDVSKKDVYTAQGTVLETHKDSTDALVFSNGTGIYLDPETRLEVRKFVQEPFTPNRSDMEVEPSISQTSTFLVRGSVGLCTSKPVAGSSMTYKTPFGSVAMRGCKVAIETNDKQTKVSLISGDVTVRGGEMDMGGSTLRQGQQAIITPGKPGEASTIVVQDIPAAELASIDQKVSMACMAKNTVYFDTASKKKENDRDPGSAFDDTADEIVVTPLVPSVLPVQHSVSPASISK